MNDKREVASIPGDSPSTRAGSCQADPRSSPRGRILAERLRAASLAAHLTQQELAGKRFSKNSISAIELGKMFPSLQALAILAETLAVPVSYLLGESEIDARALEESYSVVDAVVAHHSQINAEEARQGLGKAETFIHQDQPETAWEQLGGHDEPPTGWQLQLRPHWTWLAGWTLTLLGRPTDAIHALEQGPDSYACVRLVPGMHNWDEMIEWLNCLLGVAHCAQGQTTLSLQFYTQGLEAINHGRVGDAELKLLIYKGLANEYFALARYEEAIGCYQKALAEVQNSDNKRQHGLTTWGLTRAYQQQGDVFRAKSYYRQALQTPGEHGNLQLLAQIRALYGLALIDLEDFEEAERQLQLSLDGAGKVGDSGTRGMALTYFAFLSNTRGDPDQSPLAVEAMLEFTLVAAYTARGDWAAAEQAYEDAIQLAERIPHEGIRGH